MSRFMPEMDRDAVQWQKPVGTWKKNEGIVRLAEIAERLVFPPELEHTDVLNSIPTPWSRLLLFENALFNELHPSHFDVRDQWRGLLGLLALAKPLGIDIKPSNEEYVVDLNNFSGLQIAKTFLDLQPYLIENQINVEAGKWSRFHLIAVEDHLLGATSPRTVVFTAIDHRCPPSVPFQTNEHKVADPFEYFKRFGDVKYLSLLRQWLHSFTTSLQADRDFITWLGVVPTGKKKTANRRFDRLLALLTAWQQEMDSHSSRSAPSIALGPLEPAFSVRPFDALLFLPEIPKTGDSDLLLGTEKALGSKVVVGFLPDKSETPVRTSTLHNQRGQLVVTESLQICDGRWTTADALEARALAFLPPGWLSIPDPIALFEDYIIEVDLPEAAEDTGAVYELRAGQKTFLYPFKEEILNFFTPAELAQFTSIEIIPDQGYKVTLQFPLIKGGSVRATRRYLGTANELVLVNNSAIDHETSELAMWPNFSAPDWSYYFYFKRRKAPKDKPGRNLDFTPVGLASARLSHDEASAWYCTTQPVKALVGTVDGRRGLFLPRYEELPQIGEKDYWNVSVDFGSTHTRVFYIKRRKEDDGSFVTWDGARVEQLDFNTYAKQLTICDPERLRNDFFALVGKLDPPTRVELKTILMQPVSDSTRYDDWRPREGFAFMQWIKGGFDERKLKSDIKWENGGNRQDLHSYLRCLMVMVLAEAAKRNAEVKHVTRSYPTAFNNTLRAHHNTEWVALGAAMKLEVDSEMDSILTEAVATARYLGGKLKAQLTNNVVSLDIGGSTTDVAIWYGKRGRSGQDRLRPTLGLQESVKMSAGSVGRYLQSDPHAQRFLQWFVKAVKNQNVFPDLQLESYAGRRSGFALMFYNILSYYEVAGPRLRKEYNALVGLIKTREESRGLVMHLVYLFGALCYYAGLLARKTELQERKPPIYHLYFCGKGGTLVTWINNYERFVQKLFLAGLYGPEGSSVSTSGVQPSVEVKISPTPKEEVGRGLLEEFVTRTDVEGDEDNFGLLDSGDPSVTVGETGFRIRKGNTTSTLLWNDVLSEPVLRDLDEHFPSFAELKELNCFIGAIMQAFKGQSEDDPRLDFEGFLKSDSEQTVFIDRLANRLLGEEEGAVLRELERPNSIHALMEPILITEMKLLLEMLSNNDRLFR